MPWKDPKNPKKLAYRKAYNKLYRENNRQYFRDAYNKWSKENSENNLNRRNKYLSTPENRLKNNARSAVYQAVKKGILIRPDVCSNCGFKGKIEADHADYSKKLEVVWLCKSCHTIVGMERKQIQYKH